jgi:exodeoxyribonuclease III
LRTGPGAFCLCAQRQDSDADIWDPTVFIGSTHVTPQERAVFAVLRGHGLTDVIPRIAKGPRPVSYWDYRAGAFHKEMGKRIDLVYANGAFTGLVKDASIDHEARKSKAPSDHAPVIVDSRRGPSRAGG